MKRVKFKDLEQLPKIQVRKDFKQNFEGSAPAPFIGRFGYPHVNVGVLSPQFVGNVAAYDSPRLWSSANASISGIAQMRYGLVNSRQKSSIRNLNSRFMEVVQEVGMATKAAELEISLHQKPLLKMKSEKEIIPWGPAATVEKSRIVTNTKIDTRIEKVVDDTDLKAASGVIKLYQKGFEETNLNKLLSVGNLGLKSNRKLVPTRWSITAVDDTVGKDLIKDIKKLPIGDFGVYFGGGWGNYFLILMFPEVWSYELYETYMHKDVNPWSKDGYMYSTDNENYDGRKTYAEETAGGYYASRLAVTEGMKKSGRQNSCLVLRFITSEYNIPLGVWTVREAARKSISGQRLLFLSKDEMIAYAKELIRKNFDFDLELLLSKSKLLATMKTQPKLASFFANS
jgi:DNA repair protein NreA